MRFFNSTCRMVTLLYLACLVPALRLPDGHADTPPPYAALVNALVQPGDTVWFAPAEFHDWLMVNAVNAAAPYYFVYPWLWDDPKIRTDILARLQAHPPAVIVMHRLQPVAGVAGWELEEFAPELTAWVDEHYQASASHPDVYQRR